MTVRVAVSWAAQGRYQNGIVRAQRLAPLEKSSFIIFAATF